MTFLALNGIQIPVVDASPSRSIKRRGARGRGFRGEVHDGTRGSRRSWDMRACFTDIADGFAEAEAFVNMLTLGGHRVTFGTGLQASTGLNPMPGASGMTWNSAVGYDGEPGYLDTTATTLLQYDAQLGDDWSVLFREGGTSPLWLGGATFNSAGRASYNGTSYDYVGFDQGNDHLMEVIDGVVTFTGTTTSTLNDVVILPWVITDAIADLWSAGDPASGGPVWGPLPVLRVTGQVMAESFSYVLGDVTGETFLQKPQRVSGNIGGTWINNARVINFTLVEVPQTFVRSDVL